MILFDARQTRRINNFYNYTAKENILSIDPMVWPSIFDTGIAPGFSITERHDLGYSGYRITEWIGKYTHFWDDYSNMINFIISHQIELDDITLVRFSNIKDECKERNSYFAGFDVCCESFISAITNYFPNGICEFKNELNSHFLFAKYETARAFMHYFKNYHPEEDLTIWSIYIIQSTSSCYPKNSSVM